MANVLVHDYWVRSSRYRLVHLLTLLGVITLTVPMQHYMSLGRYQHYAMGIALFGLGYIVQLLVAWKRFPTWGRISLCLTGIFLLGVAYVFWSNPWLDWKVAVQTEGKEEFRSQLMTAYLCSAGIIVASWIKFGTEEHRLKQKNPGESGGET